jgi:ribosomal protein L6P/L9E
VYLELRGLGYRMRVVEGGLLEFFLGYSHAVTFRLPTSVSATVVGSKSRVLELTAMS